MTHPSTIARDSAQHCEAKKHGLRQTQDGIVVSFVLHPNEVPAALQLAQLGTRYMLALVEIGDDEKPITGKEANAPTVAKPALDPDPPVRAPRKWEDLAPSMQAAIRCNEVPFVKFLNTQACTVTSTNDAAEFVRAYCGVESRRDIRTGDPLARWQELESKYRAWMYGPSFGAGAA